MEIVPFNTSHIAVFTKLFNALPNNDMWDEEWILFKSLDDEAFDPALMIAAEENGEPVGFMLGSISDKKGWIRAFLVHPDRRRRGIGTAMFDTVEHTFEERGVEEIVVGYALPNYLIPGVDISYTSAIIFLYRRGYETNRETRVNMDVLLTGRDFSTVDQEDRLRENGIVIRRALSGDRAGITQLCETSGYPKWGAESGIGLEKHLITVFVAEKEGIIYAFAAYSVCGPIYFGPMLTSMELRGMGTGSVLVRRCLLDMQQAGIKRCEIAWAGPLSFYVHAAGATMGRAFWVFSKSFK